MSLPRARYSGLNSTYLIARTAAGLYWRTDTNVLEAFNAAHIANYAKATTDASGEKEVTPANLTGLTNGAYTLRHFEKVGGSYDWTTDGPTEFWYNEGSVDTGSWTEGQAVSVALSEEDKQDVIDGVVEGVGDSAGATVVISAGLINTNNPRFTTTRMAAIVKGSAPIDVYPVVDGSKAPIDLSGHALRMTFGTADDVAEGEAVTFTGVGQYTTSGGGLTIQGTDNSNVSIQHSTAITGTARELHWWLWDVTDGESAAFVLARGTVPIEEGVKSV